jgi:hypothetical protein
MRTNKKKIMIVTKNRFLVLLAVFAFGAALAPQAEKKAKPDVWLAQPSCR